MDITIFDNFGKICSQKLPNEINKILTAAKGKNVCSIGFVTTDDFYGFSLVWEYNTDINEYYNWRNGLQPDFLYQPVVDIVDSCKDIDLCAPSDEKWDFAKALLSVLEKCIKQIPEEIFVSSGFKREDILFFSTMGDGDYVEEMLDLSVKMFNSAKTLEKYGIGQ